MRLGKTLQLLHIDDSSILRKSVSRGLEPFSDAYELTQADSVDQALTLLNSGKKIDVIVTDWLMSGKSGLNLLCSLKSDPKYHHLPVFFLTSEYDSSSLLIAVTHGAGGIIKKPVTGPELHSYLQKKMSFIEESQLTAQIPFAPTAREILSEMAPLLELRNLKNLHVLESFVQKLRVKATASKWPLLADYSQKILDALQLTLKNEVGVLTPISRILKDYHSFMSQAVINIENFQPHPLINESVEAKLKNYQTNLEAGWFTDAADEYLEGDVVIPRDVALELQQHLSPAGLQLLERYLKTA